MLFVSYVDARGAPATASSDIPFLVDSGSERTILSRSNCESRLALPVTILPETAPLAGLGGEATTRYVQGAISFVHEDQRLSVFPLTFAVVDLPFSLLARDVLSLGKLTIDFRERELTLELPTS